MMRMMKTVIMYVILLALVMLNWIAIAKAKPEEGDRSGGGRKYNLDVALYGMTNASGRHRWRTSAEREKVTLALTNFAYCVYEMTDGCHRLGTITVYELGKGEPLPKANCDIIWEKLNAIPGISAHKPQGAFYIWADIRGTGLSSDEIKQLNKAF